MIYLKNYYTKENTHIWKLDKKTYLLKEDIVVLSENIE